MKIERLQELLECHDGLLYWRVKRRRLGGHTTPGQQAGYVSGNGYRYVGIDGKRLLEHRVVFAMTHGRVPSKHIDHINGNKTDNRPENLRECTHSENLQNVGMRSDNTTGVRGVSWDRRRKKYAAELILQGRKKYLGRFDTLAEAAAAREAAEIKHFPFRRVMPAA